MGAGEARDARGAKAALGASFTLGASGAFRMVKVPTARGAEGARGALGAGRKAKTWKNGKKIERRKSNRLSDALLGFMPFKSNSASV